MDSNADATMQVHADELKACCATLYSSDLARQLLGESFHPGGLALTERLGVLLDLGPGKRVLDVATGRGASAIFLAQRFGCEVIGVEYGSGPVREATCRAAAESVGHLVRFEQGDAECLTLVNNQFDVVVCECAFCTFPNKYAAAGEFARVLRPNGKVGLTDLTRSGEVPPELQGLLAWIACIADARPIDEYAHYLEQAGLEVDLIEPHNDALSTMVQDIRTKLFAAELLVKFKQIHLPTVDFEQAKALTKSAAAAIQAHQFGYALIIATKPEEGNVLTR
jgi:ubiquinone/menaquinone biosynthesis C-methylase UbiE